MQLSIAMDLCETPEDFFRGTRIDEINMPNIDYWKLKIAISEYVKGE